MVPPRSAVSGQEPDRLMARPSLIPEVHPLERLVGQAPSIIALRAHIRQLVTFDTVGNALVPTVLLQGETGTGKGLVARVIHDSGPRAEGPFIEVNCAAIPESMLEAELFGFEAGAFTDAKRAKPGLWEAASGGSLFLDEIDAMPLVLQSKLLTVIEAKRVRRLGAVAEQPTDVKLIAATQMDLRARIAAGQFRADLYHRLAVVLLEVPPLRERGADILLLARHALRGAAEAYRLPSKRLHPQAEVWLQRYAWPGNVRELGHLMERVSLLCPDPQVRTEVLERLCTPLVQPCAPTPVGPPEAHTESADEAALIQHALQQTAGNVARAARLLGMSRGALRHRLVRYQIAPPHQPGRMAAAKPRQRTEPHTGPAVPQDNRSPLWLSRAVTAPPQSWEQKPVAVLAVEVTWPATHEVWETPYEPWTVTSHWEKMIVEKLRFFGGVVLSHSPSQIVTVFGIPQTLEQAPQRAVQAALTLRRLVLEARDEGPSPELRLAIHWGQVLVDTEANDPSTSLLAVGDTLTRPGRLLGPAESGEIIASGEIAHLIRDGCELRARQEPVRIGAPSQIGAYSVIGLRDLGAPLQRHGQRRLSRFVGREREAAALEDLLERARQGRGQVVGILGEPGVGKSRLCYEFVRAHQTNDWLILETSAASYSQATPYLPVIELLKSYCQIGGGHDASKLRDTVADRLRTLGLSLNSTLPAVLTLLDSPVEDSAWQALDPLQRRQQLLGAIKRLLIRASQLQPMVLFIENLHWIDGETQALLDSLVDGLHTARLLLLVTYRPEYQHGWTSKTSYSQLRVDPLPPGPAQELLRSLLGDDLSLGPLAQTLLQRTEGNPFFLEESIQTLVETGVLEGESGSYRLAPSAGANAHGRLQECDHGGLPRPIDLHLPATVQAVLLARVDRLAPAWKRLLQIAAVIGIEVPCPLLQAVAELSEAELHDGLAHLQATEFLCGTDIFPDVAFSFKHALTREMAYGSLLPAQRRTLHARIVDAIEHLYVGSEHDRAERLAQHAFLGGVWDKAVAYCWQASTRAFARSAQREVVVYSEQALVALKHLPESRTMREQAIDLRLDLRHALLVLGESRQALDCLREAVSLARDLGDQPRLGWVSAYMCRHCREMGDHRDAVEAGEQALAVAATLGDFPLQVMARQFLGVAYHLLGDHQRAMELLRSNVQSVTGDMLRERFGGLPSVLSRAWSARCLAELGAFPEGAAHGQEAIRLAETVDHPNSRVIAYLGVGFVCIRQGDFARAISVLERAVELCREWNILNWFPDTASVLSCAYACGGHTDEAVALLEHAEQSVTPTAAMGGQSLRLGLLSETYLLTGRMEAAVQLAERALTLAHEHQERGYQAWTLRLLGEVAAHQQPTQVQPAEHHYHQAMALAAELGMRPLQAHCHRGLGTLYTKIGRTEHARVALATAIALYRTMGMTFWLSQAEEVLVQAV
jgi:DNA-binding NtrC family response regulator/tetratricopeptide (TPR) repeat protein